MPSQPEPLGGRLYITALKLQGTLPQTETAEVLREVITDERIGGSGGGSVAGNTVQVVNTQTGAVATGTVDL